MADSRIRTPSLTAPVVEVSDHSPHRDRGVATANRVWCAQQRPTRTNPEHLIPEAAVNPRTCSLVAAKLPTLAEVAVAKVVLLAGAVEYDCPDRGSPAAAIGTPVKSADRRPCLHGQKGAVGRVDCLRRIVALGGIATCVRSCRGRYAQCRAGHQTDTPSPKAISVVGLRVDAQLNSCS